VRPECFGCDIDAERTAVCLIEHGQKRDEGCQCREGPCRCRRISPRHFTEGIPQHSLQELERINPDVIVPMHCTGEAFIVMLRERLPEKVVYSNVGSRFLFGAGPRPTLPAPL
jgi:L-ascorbate metabolism protein UlaG (beta-lactamase superfamily)